MERMEVKADQITVSVVMITYNHEAFVAEAIESILMQQAKFRIELIISEDCSTDNTRSIVVDYKERYPDRIRLLLPVQNLGAMSNFVSTLNACSGKYIALCEGDDYWIDPLKLQKQVDVLESNSAYAGCAHQSIVKSKDADHLFRLGVRQEIGLNDLLFGRLFHTASFVCRAVILKEVDLLPIDVISGDQLIYLWVASHGPIRFFEEPMCVYRKHKGGISSWVTYKVQKADLNMIPWLERKIVAFPKNRYLSHIHKTLWMSSQISLQDFFRHYLLYLFYSFSFFPTNILRVTKVSLIYFPRHLWCVLIKC